MFPKQFLFENIDSYETLKSVRAKLKSITHPSSRGTPRFRGIKSGFLDDTGKDVSDENENIKSDGNEMSGDFGITPLGDDFNIASYETPAKDNGMTFQPYGKDETFGLIDTNIKELTNKVHKPKVKKLSSVSEYYINRIISVNS